MNWNVHKGLEGSHAFLGASRSSWLNYNEEDLQNAWKRQYAQSMGTSLHELAAKLIENRIKINEIK